MRPETIAKLCCPFDKADLELTTTGKDLEGNVLEGFFECTECKRIYPIMKGVPIMNPDEYREFHLEQPMLEAYGAHVNKQIGDNFKFEDSSSNLITD
jgi:uncharacterized protein YbaR (Trm112 family)